MLNWIYNISVCDTCMDTISKKTKITQFSIYTEHVPVFLLYTYRSEFVLQNYIEYFHQISIVRTKYLYYNVEKKTFSCIEWKWIYCTGGDGQGKSGERKKLSAPQSHRICPSDILFIIHRSVRGTKSWVNLGAAKVDLSDISWTVQITIEMNFSKYIILLLVHVFRYTLI